MQKRYSEEDIPQRLPIDSVRKPGASVWQGSQVLPGESAAFRAVIERIMQADREAAGASQFSHASAGRNDAAFRAAAVASRDFEEASPLRQNCRAAQLSFVDMTPEELKTFFDWRMRLRAALREGRALPRAPAEAYVRLWIAAAANGGEPGTPLEVWEKLHAFWQKYRVFLFTLDRSMPVWLDFFADYWGLSTERFKRLPAADQLQGKESAPAFDWLALREGQTDASAIGEQLVRYSYWRAEESAFFRQYPAELPNFLRLAGEGWRLWALSQGPAAFYRTIRKFYMRLEFFGWDFVFDIGQQPLPNVTRNPDGVLSIFTDKDVGTAVPQLDILGRPVVRDFLRAAESLTRVRAGKKGIRSKVHTEMTAALERASKAWDQAASEAANPARKIDFAALAGIRADADINRDRLVLPEELGEAAATEKNAPAFGMPSEETEAAQLPAAPARKPAKAIFEEKASSSDSVVAPLQAADETGLLTPAEAACLKALLEGKAPELGSVSPEMMADRINEKLYDEIGDAVIDAAGGMLALIEDYAEDIRALLAR